MEQLKLIWHDNGKHNSTSSSVSVREFTDIGVFDVISPTDIVGTGSYYGAALEDFADQLNNYIANLEKFRDEIVNSERAYKEAVRVDYSGSPIIKE